MQRLTLAIRNPPQDGEYRVFNQFAEIYDVVELAEKVRTIAREIGITVDVMHLESSRAEQEEHYYNPDHQRLVDLGYKPTGDVGAESGVMLDDLVKHTDRIEEAKAVLIPDVRWDGMSMKSAFIDPIRSERH